MLSLRSALLKLQLRIAQPIVRFTGIEASRRAQDALGAITSRLLETKVTYEDVPFDTFEACYAVPAEGEAPDRVVLYLHGGGYTAGGIQYCKAFGGVLAATSGLRVLCVAYRLAPEHKYPAAVDDAEAAYDYLLAHGYAPERIAFAGESAGGGLIYCLAHRLREKGKPLPKCMLGISPWSDLTMSGAAYQNNVLRDPSLCRESLAYYVLVYAAGHEDEPTVSPIFGDFSDFPPSLLFAGGDEILLDDSRTLHRRLLEAGCEATLHIEPHMWHVYPLYGTPEGTEAVRRMAGFLREGLEVAAS